MLALAGGALCGYLHSPNLTNFNQTHTQRYRATVLSCDAGTSGAFDCAILLDDGRTVRAFLARTAPAGTRFLLRARFAPFDAPRNPGEPDQRILESERGFSGTLQGATILRQLDPGPMNLAIAVAVFHANAASRLRAYLDEPYASILAGELWGERAAFPPDLRAEFQDTGTVHILVTAGLHLSVVAFAVLGILVWCGIPRPAVCALTGAAVWSYVIFSGAHLPGMRAALMISFALCARALGRKSLSWNGLAAAFIVILLVFPQSLQSASFAMSFSCVGSILLLGPVIEPQLHRIPALPSIARETLTLTLATQIGVWPLTASTFLLFAPYAAIANAAVVPLVGVTMILGALQILSASVSPAAHACANLNLWLLQWMTAVVRTCATLPNAHVVMSPPPPWTIALYDGALLAFVWLFRKGATTAATSIVIVAIATALWPPANANHSLQITVLDVGQADAILVRTPSGRALLIDAGGRLERGARTAQESTAERVGETVVVPFLIRHGIHHLDAMLLSHPHGDHAGGVAPVLRALGADEFADTGQSYGGFAYRDAIAVAQVNRTPLVYPRAGTVWRTNDGVTLHFLGPSVPFISASRNDINNNSLVFMLEYKGFRMLFTGDAGAEAEQRILADGVDLHATVLKVGHHGSAYSSTPEFIEAVQPKYAIISVGRHNLFGHPAPATVATLRRFGARVFRTDENGAVTIGTDGENLNETAFLGLNGNP